MTRDHRKLRVYADADAFVLRIYLATRSFPTDERYVLAAQLRRAAISIVCNIVEGSARATTREYVHFLNIAGGSVAESRYLCDLGGRLGYIPTDQSAQLVAQATHIAGALEALRRGVSRVAKLKPLTPKP